MIKLIVNWISWVDSTKKWEILPTNNVGDCSQGQNGIHHQHDDIWVCPKTTNLPPIFYIRPLCSSLKMMINDDQQKKIGYPLAIKIGNGKSIIYDIPSQKPPFIFQRTSHCHIGFRVIPCFHKRKKVFACPRYPQIDRSLLKQGFGGLPKFGEKNVNIIIYQMYRCMYV